MDIGIEPLDRDVLGGPGEQVLDPVHLHGIELLQGLLQESILSDEDRGRQQFPIAIVQHIILQRIQRLHLQLPRTSLVVEVDHLREVQPLLATEVEDILALLVRLQLVLVLLQDHRDLGQLPVDIGHGVLVDVELALQRIADVLLGQRIQEHLGPHPHLVLHGHVQNGGELLVLHLDPALVLLDQAAPFVLDELVIRGRGPLQSGAAEVGRSVDPQHELVPRIPHLLIEPEHLLLHLAAAVETQLVA